MKQTKNKLILAGSRITHTHIHHMCICEAKPCGVSEREREEVGHGTTPGR